MIREYKPEDIVFIEKLGREIDKDYRFKINKYTNCLVYELDGNIIAFVNYFILHEKSEIIDIVVDDEYKRQKIGTKLLNKVIEVCKENGCENVTLEVRSNDEGAKAFYKSFGFREASVRRSYYDDGEDALLMIKML